MIFGINWIVFEYALPSPALGSMPCSSPYFETAVEKYYEGNPIAYWMNVLRQEFSLFPGK